MPSYGFYCTCTSIDHEEENSILNLDKAWALGKNTSNIIIGGVASNIKKQGKANGVTAEQRACGQQGIVHGAGRWCIKPRLARITCLWVIEQKPIPTSDTDEN